MVFDTPIRKTCEVLMEIRPENLVRGSQEDVPLEGTTVLVEPMGSSNLVSIRVGESEMKMYLARPPMQGTPLSFSFSSRHALFFEAHSGLRLYPHSEK
jgi:ABC-type sugar transport system ATPase subunit